MRAESMTCDERFTTAVRLGKPDRVPVVPTLQAEGAAGYTGLSMAAVAGDNRVVVDTMFEVFDDCGGWDNPYPCAATPLQLQVTGSHPMLVRIPGRHLADDEPFQLEEREILQREDYDTICETGFEKFFYDDYLWRIADITPDLLPAELAEAVAGLTRFAAGCSRRGVTPYFLGAALHPFFTLSLTRSMTPFTQDLYYRPELVERALERMTTDLIERQLPLIRASGVDRWLFTEERASGFFYPPAVFERFWWPYTRRVVEACWSEGIVTIFHLDQCWDRNLKYFRELPVGSAILEFDGLTDIRRAREVLGGHLCIKGDVPATLLAIGTPEDVSAYCRNLIDEVGRDGGFILGTGCCVPPNVRPENFRAMIRTAKGHEFA